MENNIQSSSFKSNMTAFVRNRIVIAIIKMFFDLVRVINNFLSHRDQLFVILPIVRTKQQLNGEVDSVVHVKFYFTGYI
jgi:hypothetical protein